MKGSIRIEVHPWERSLRFIPLGEPGGDAIVRTDLVEFEVEVHADKGTYVLHKIINDAFLVSEFDQMWEAVGRELKKALAERAK